MANNAANFNRFIVTCKYIAEMSAASTLGFTRMIGRTDMWRSMFHRGEKFDQPLYDLLTFLVKHGYSREVALLNLEAQLIEGPKAKSARPGEHSIQNSEAVLIDQGSDSSSLGSSQIQEGSQIEQQKPDEDREKRLKFLDTVYVLFEQIKHDDEFKKQLVELIHAFARENDLPSKIINVKKHAARMAKESSPSVQSQLAAIDADLNLLNQHQQAKKKREADNHQAKLDKERLGELERANAKHKLKNTQSKAQEHADSDTQPLLTSPDEGQASQTAKEQVSADELEEARKKVTDRKPQAAFVDNSDVLLANTKRNRKELRTRRDAAFYETTYTESAHKTEDTLTAGLKRTREAYLRRVLVNNKVLVSATVEDGGDISIPDVACPNSRYAVVWDLDAIAQADFKQRLVNERRRDQLDPEYKMNNDAWDVSIKSPKAKQSSKRIKKILKVLALIFTVIMCIGEGIVPAAISGAVLVGICAFIINLPLIYRGLSVAFSHLFSGKMLRDKYGNPLPNVLGLNKRNIIIAAVINCMAAGAGYACLSFKYSHSALAALASLASSLATTKLAFLAPLVSLIAANPVLLAAVIAVSCFVSMSCLFYYYFGCGVRDGVVDGIKEYFRSRFVAKTDEDGHEVKVEAWERVVNALKLLLTLALAATTVTLVFCYFSSLVTQFFQIPLEGTTFLAAASANSVGFVFSTAALLPNCFFIMKNMVRVTDFLVDTVFALPFMIYNYAETWSAIKGYFQRVCEHPLTAYFHIKSALLIGAGVYMMKNNSFDGQSQGYARNARVGDVVLNLFQKIGLSLQAAVTAVRVVILGHSGGPLMQEHVDLVKTPYQTAFARHAELDKVVPRSEDKPASPALAEFRAKNIACRANVISSFWQSSRAAGITDEGIAVGKSEGVESIIESRYQSLVTASA